jgi:hypothetical protein
VSTIQFVGGAVGVTSATLPAHQAGDLILAYAYNAASNTIPTAPAEFTFIASQSGNTNALIVAWRIATGSGTASGEWTNAQHVGFQVYRNVDQTAPIGTVRNGSATNSTSISYPALTGGTALQVQDGTSWVAGIAGHRSINTALETPPSDMVNRTTRVGAQGEIAGHDTASGVSSYPGATVAAGGTNSAYRTYVVEIKQEQSAGTVAASATVALPKLTSVSGATVSPPVVSANASCGLPALTSSSTATAEPPPVTATANLTLAPISSSASALVAASNQYARPNADVSTGSWTATPLFSKVNESSANDSPFISSDNNTNGDTAELALSSVTAPSAGTVTVRVRSRKSASAGHTIDHVVALVQGGTVIATSTVADITEVWTTRSFALTTAQRDSITDWADLRIRLTRNGSTGGAGGTRRSLDVSWVELEAPGGAAAPTVTATSSVTLSALTISSSANAEPPTVVANAAFTLPTLTASASSTAAAPVQADQIDLYVQLLDGNGDPLTSEILAATNVDLDDPTAPITRVTLPPLSLTRQELNDARLRVRWAYTGSGSPTTVRLETIRVELAYVPSNVVGFDATAAVTLPSLTASADTTAQQPAYAAATAATLPSLTASASTSVEAPVFAATAAAVLPALTSASSGTVAAPVFTAAIAAILPALTSASTATAAPVFTASTGAILPSLASASTATVAVPIYTATIAATLPPLTLTASTTVAAPVFTATSATFLPALTSSASATAAAPIVTATTAATLSAITGTSSATAAAPIFTATSAALLPALTSAASAATQVPEYVATIDAVFPPLTAQATATAEQPEFTATANVTLPALTASATATAPRVDATADITLPALTSAASAITAAPIYAATAEALLPALTASATAATDAPVYTATADATLAALTSSSSATVEPPVFAATADALLPALTSASTAAVFQPVYTATVTADLPALTSSATTVVEPPPVLATVAASLPSLTAWSESIVGFPFSLIPDGDVSQNNVTSTGASFFDQVNEDPTTLDAGFVANASEANASIRFTLTNAPSDFDSAHSLRIVIRARRGG